ncbi:1364_t:CDS:10 [Diversispora eburnea]|uniref:1364_t:CDS:1 n=1 Tax=Diversispora eburnea TaxID=1213867 RepID=A0A9N8V112_9GLOM|nr:1364_t:CDS:10 [Diversispora eburnea]
MSRAVRTSISKNDRRTYKFTKKINQKLKIWEYQPSSNILLKNVKTSKKLFQTIASAHTSEGDMIKILNYIEEIMLSVRPKKLLYIAIDGVAPRAKMNLQRSRRFNKARKERGKGDKLRESDRKRFDSNCITPGTPFMTKLANCLRNWIAEKFNSGEWRNLKVILSDSSVPGEGEHKIMDFIRAQKTNIHYDPNTRHIIYGSDADLILLSLGTHEPHFKVLREDNSEEVVREYLATELKGSCTFDLENAIDDWILLCSLVSNDFLPHLPSLEIREGAINRLIPIWKNCHLSMGGYITNNGNVNLEKVQYLFTELSKIEDEIFISRHKSVQFNTDNKDPVRLWESGFKERYYKNKFDIELPNHQFRADYVEGICWVMKYYFQGVPSWKWYYPYHYSPFSSDFTDIRDIKIDFTLGEPFKPFELLMGVLPADSKENLPKQFHVLMESKNSEIFDFYHTLPSQGVDLLPFIDESRLLKAVNSIYPTLGPEETARNKFGSEILCLSSKHKLYDPKISDQLIGYVARDNNFIVNDKSLR